jgi:hypothetical protein
MKISLIISIILISFKSMAQADFWPHFTQNKNTLTLFFIPSPYPIDWSGPSQLFWSNLKNQLSLQARKLGHVNVHLSCDNKPEVLTGMTASNFDAKSRILLHGQGFGILWHSFAGKLEDMSELKQELPQYTKQNRLSFLSVKLSESNCHRLIQYLDEFKQHKVDRYYGLAHRPLFLEGAGCSAFGASFLEVAGIKLQGMDQWSGKVRIAEKLLGAPIRDKYVSLIDLLTMPDSWEKANRPAEEIFFYDPNYMHQWVIKTHQSNQLGLFQAVDIMGAKGLIIDYSSLQATAAPIWRQAQDERYYLYQKLVEEGENTEKAPQYNQ